MCQSLQAFLTNSEEDQAEIHGVRYPQDAQHVIE